MPGKKLLQCRYFVALIGFLTYTIFSIQTTSTSVSIVVMVNHSATKSQVYFKRSTVSCSMNIKNITENTDHKYSGEFQWSPQIQSYILGARSFGFIPSSIVGGILSEMIGAKITLIAGMFIISLSHLISPFASWKSSYFMIAVQLLRGIGQGFLPASTFVLTANWTPRQERGMVMSFIMSGLCVGSIIGGVTSGVMCASTLFNGWPSVYYIFGALGLFISVIYSIFIYETPKHHPTISDSERKYITDNQETDLSEKRPPTPWYKILTSAPFYAMTVAIFGNTWATTHFLSVHPIFLGTILNFSIEENGLFASVPFALNAVFTLIASWISEWLIRNKYLGLSKARKGINLISCLGYSLSVFGIFAAGCEKTASSVFSILALGFVGFGNASCVINPIDLSPTFTGIIMGLCSPVAYSASYILPVIVGILTNEQETLDQWNKMFFISIAVVMTSGIVFCLFGSAEVQPWNFLPDEHLDKSKTINSEDNKLKSYDNPNFQPDTSHL